MKNNHSSHCRRCGANLSVHGGHNIRQLCPLCCFEVGIVDLVGLISFAVAVPNMEGISIAGGIEISDRIKNARRSSTRDDVEFILDLLIEHSWPPLIGDR